MKALILRRLRDMLIVLFIVGTTIFFIIHSIPGNPAAAMLGPYATKDQIDQLTVALGLDQPLPVQYVKWLFGVIQGDFGNSISSGRPVMEIIMRTATPTVLIAICSTVLSVAVSVPLAIRAAAKPRSLLARLVSPVTSFWLAMPSFWLALVLILIFGVAIRIFPVSGYVNPFENPAGIIYLVLPVVVLASNQVALFTATLRESISGELLQLYLRTARSKGLKEVPILHRHVLRNALLPMITVVASSLGTLLGGAIIVETIFVIPGWGLTLYSGIISRDYPIVIGLTMVMALLFVVVNLVADLLYVVADPKVRLK